MAGEEDINCPFYGFRQIAGIFVRKGAEEDQCGLRTSSYVPCQMEKPDWRNCPYNLPKVREILVDVAGDFMVFPDKGDKKSSGAVDEVLTLDEWLERFWSVS